MKKGRTFKITEYQMSEIFGFEKVNFDIFNLSLFRYFPYFRLKEMLDENKIAFVYPALWKDPFETIYLETNYTDLGYKQRKIYCLCGRNTNENEEASWKMYSGGDNYVVRVHFNLINLFLKIKEFAKERKCKVYFVRISYDLEGDEIKGIAKNRDLSKKYLDNFCERKYISLLSLKRPDFKYEDEWRIFIVPQEDSNLNLNEDILKIPIDASVFFSFTINPLENNNESNIYNQQAKEIKEFIQAKIPNSKVVCSDLYKDVAPIKSISIAKK